MDINLKISIDVPQEVIDKIVSALGKSSIEVNNLTTDIPAIIPPDIKDSEIKDNSPLFTLDDIRNRIRELNSIGKRDDVILVFEKLNYVNPADIPEEKYPFIMEKLSNL